MLGQKKKIKSLLTHSQKILLAQNVLYSKKLFIWGVHRASSESLTI
jgi:hypothetical protein